MRPAHSFSRRALLAQAAIALAAAARPQAQLPPPSRMATRPIPSSGEALPVIGLGTYRGFDVRPGAADYQALPGVLDALVVAGGSVIDSSPMYGLSLIHI